MRKNKPIPLPKYKSGQKVIIRNSECTIEGNPVRRNHKWMYGIVGSPFYWEENSIKQTTSNEKN